MIQNQNITAQFTGDSQNHRIWYFGPFDFNIMKNEIWKDVPGYEGLYQVSDLGRIKSLVRKTRLRERILIPLINRGYYCVDLSKNGQRKMIKISILVAMAFLGHKPDGTHKIVVDHLDNIKAHNCVSNLQLITNRENCSKDKFRHNYSSKHVGVCWVKRDKKWKSQICINGELRNLGYFDDEIEASNAYQLALKKRKQI